MFREWQEGNKPLRIGTYWVTVKNNGGKGDPIQTLPFPLRYGMGEWFLPDGGKYFADNVVAHMECIIPKPYDPKRIGISGEFYIKVTRQSGAITYYSKQLQTIDRSKIGYSTKEKAIAAMKRLKKLDQEEMGDWISEDVYEIVDGDGNIIA